MMIKLVSNPYTVRSGILALGLVLAGCENSTGDQSDTAETPVSYGSVQWPAIESPVKKTPDVEAKIEALVAKMSVEEKVGQIIQAEIKTTTPEDVRKYHLGSVLNGGGSMPNRNKHATPKEWLDLADAYYDASMDVSDGGQAIPIIWGSDAVHGHNNVIGATIFPHNIGLGAARNPALMREIGRITAREVRVTGIDWTFAPTLAVAQNDRWGRTYESYSEDPEIVKSYAGEFVYGLQGVPGTPEFLDADHVVATAKHFLGDGGTEDGDDQGDARLSEEDLRDIHGAGYETALGAGVQTVMASFSSWNGHKMHGNHYMLTKVLKEQMGLDGLVVGDWNGHGQVPGCTNVSCAAAFNAGLDLFMAPDDWKGLYANTLAQVKSGEISMARLDDAVTRILRVKIRAGLFSKGKPSVRGIAGHEGIIGSDEHRRVARRAVRESLVLLKNKGGILPISGVKTLLVAGDGAHNIGKQSGGWTITWQGTGNTNADFPGATSIFDGLLDAMAQAGGRAILSEDGSYDKDKKPDVAVVVFGENPYAESQGDRETLEFEPGTKRALTLIRKLKAADIPVVSVFLSGRPLWVNAEINASDAFVAAWLPGSEGAGVSDVLVADEHGEIRHDFKGTLSFSWPKTPLQAVLDPQRADYDPAFAFGYGLTYASIDEGPVDLAEDVEGVASASRDEIVLYSGRALEPWQVYVDDGGTPMLLSGPVAVLPGRRVSLQTADMEVQEDALRLTSDAGNVAALTIDGGPSLDLSAMYAQGAVEFNVRLDEVPADGVRVSVADKSREISGDLAGAVGAGWKRVSYSLKCFAGSADDLRAVTRPFKLEIDGKGSVSVGRIQFLTKATSAKMCA